MFRKAATTMFTSALALLLMAGVAGAHATVSPKTVTPGSFEKFTLRVPVEKEIATTKIKVDVPEGFTVSRVKPMPGWTYTTEKTADGKSITSIIWSGGKIEAGEFQEFEFQGKTAEQAGKYAFRAYQTYADGETVAWAGPSDAKTPASIMEVKPAEGATTDAHGQEKPATPAAAEQKPAATPSAAPAPAAAGGGSPMTAGAAYGGLALGAVALALSLRKR